MEKKIFFIFLLSAACAGKYKAPPPVPSIALPDGSALKPFDSASPGLARPSGLAQLNGKAYVALGNYDSSYAVRGPGFLAAFVPSTGHVDLIDLGGSDEKQCENAGFVRAAGNKIYVTCAGDYTAAAGVGSAIVEVDPASLKVTRSLPVAVHPGGVAVSGSVLWYGDNGSGAVYKVDLGNFTANGTASLQCPAGSYSTVSDLTFVNGDLYAICSNSNDSTLNRLDAASGASKGTASVGPIAAEMTETGDGRIAVISGADNKLRLVALPALTVTVGFTFASQTSTLQDVRALDSFLYTVASGSNTVQKLDISGATPKLVAEINVGEGANPWNILPLDDDQAVVSNQKLNTLVGVNFAKAAQ